MLDGMNNELKSVRNGIKILGEGMLPGASLLMDEKVGPGLVHMGAALIARAAFGVPGIAVVAANSLCTSITGKGLMGNITEIVIEKAANKKSADD